MKKTLGFIGAIISFLWLISAIQPNNEQAYYPPSATATPFAVAPQVQQLGSTLGMSVENLSAVKAQIGFSATCPAEALGCYDSYNDTIYLSPAGMANNRLGVQTTLAHEYYHHVFYKLLNDSGRKVMGDGLMVLYSKQNELGRQLRWRLQPYVDAGLVPGSDEFNSELHSIWCTEVIDTWMTQPSRDYCSKYVPNRNAIESSIR